MVAAIFQNYGQAGAIDLFGSKYGLPHGYTGESMIVMADRQEVLESLFAEVRKVARVDHPYSMHFDVFYCRGLKQSMDELWPRVKKWD